MKKISRRTKKKVKNRKRRHKRVRKNIIGTPNKPRLSVYKSNKYIYAQLIDDINEETIAAASTLKSEIRDSVDNTSNKEAAEEVGKLIAELAKENNIKEVVFDNGGFKFHGRIASLADAARDNGLKF
ncbi:MAG: 50S ribosomal protein L18 [Candidatus Mcinerneyibacterium aminivorans]|uniref:Large ribosomal subunit protein uL18 n=1 Tax=Candidatus Mcinerneyibacterium aminivorans TaxID=2703815 RepID=A0A5D0MEA7_9BACT|nr:MAG: 50S ribosomal protein L18 [Candidatus Mcinerneyibacterium aminivorans]